MRTGQIFMSEFDTRWMADAACAENPGLPWTEVRPPTVLVQLMAETCAACPAREACAAFVQEAGVTAGWWAGSSRDGRELGDYQPSGRHAHHANPDAA